MTADDLAAGIDLGCDVSYATRNASVGALVRAIAVVIEERSRDAGFDLEALIAGIAVETRALRAFIEAEADK